MTEKRTTVSSWATWGLYFFAVTLMFWPLADLTTNTWPVQLNNVMWRYGFLGLLAGFLHTPILGLVLAMCLAYARRHLVALRAMSVVGLMGAAVLLAALLFFALDVAQLENTVAAERLAAFQVGALIAELKHFTAFLALLLLGIGGWRSAVPTPAPRERKDPSWLVLNAPTAEGST